MLFWEWEWVSSLSLKVRCAYKQTWTDVHCQVVERKSTSQLLGQLPWSQWLPFILSWQTLWREQLLLVIFYWYKALRGEKRKPRNCSQFTKQQQTSPARNSPPPDWLKATMARIVPSLQLADTVHFRSLIPYREFLCVLAFFPADSPAPRSAGSLALSHADLSKVILLVAKLDRSSYSCLGDYGT